MNRPYALSCPDAPAVRLRAIGEQDLEELRLWKNAHKNAFFFKGEITPAMQRQWHQGYLARADDAMFMVEAEGRKAGCLGFRLKGGVADFYNILGAPGAGGKGVMSHAMRLMASHVLKERAGKAGCLVLKDNPALAWYEKLGFEREADGGDHWILVLNPGRLSPCPYRREEAA